MSDGRSEDIGGGYRLRQATEADRPALGMVCLRTGDSGNDATAREDDPELIGFIYAVPYQVYQPELAFVIDGPNGVCGYVLGALDSVEFYATLEAQWYPPLRARIADIGPDKASWTGSDWARHLIHHPEAAFPASLVPYPSHGHIDLLPEAQGRGFGRRAMAQLERRLAELGSKGLHLGLDPRNQKAARFYEKLGFSRREATDLPRRAYVMVKALG